MNDDDVSEPKRSPWLPGCVVLAAVALVLVVGLCSFGEIGLRRGMIHPPWVVRRLGPVQLVARSTLTPDCALEFPCGKPINILDPNIRTYYVVWIVMSWPGNDKPGITKYRLLIEPLDQH